MPSLEPITFARGAPSPDIMPAEALRECAERALRNDHAGALGYRGADLLTVPLKEDGLDIGALEVALEEGAAPRFIHTITNFHNPAGCTLSLEKRRRLLELAAAHGFLIFEDDPYREVRFEG